MQAFMTRRLEAMRRRHVAFQLTDIAHGTAPWITVDARKTLNLSSNNYLGLADHPRLKEAAIAAINTYGCGTGGSRLVTGTTPVHRELEQRLALFKGTATSI